MNADTPPTVAPSPVYPAARLLDEDDATPWIEMPLSALQWHGEPSAKPWVRYEVRVRTMAVR